MHVCINFVCVFGWVGGLLGHVCVRVYDTETVGII